MQRPCPVGGDRPGAVAPSLMPLVPPQNWGKLVPLCVALPSRGAFAAGRLWCIWILLSHIFVGDCKRQGIFFPYFFFLPIAKFLVTVPGPPQLPHIGLSFVLPNAKHVQGAPRLNSGIPAAGVEAGITERSRPWPRLSTQRFRQHKVAPGPWVTDVPVAGTGPGDASARPHELPMSHRPLYALRWVLQRKAAGNFPLKIGSGS